MFYFLLILLAIGGAAYAGAHYGAKAGAEISKFKAEAEARIADVEASIKAKL